MEGRGLAKREPANQQKRPGTERKRSPRALERVRQQQERIRVAVRALLHHIYNPRNVAQAYFRLKKESLAGRDGETWRHYGRNWRNLQGLSKG